VKHEKTYTQEETIYLKSTSYSAACTPGGVQLLLQTRHALHDHAVMMAIPWVNVPIPDAKKRAIRRINEFGEIAACGTKSSHPVSQGLTTMPES